MPDKQYQREALDIYNTSKVQYIHDIKGEGHIPPNTTTYDHIRTFTSKQIKFTWPNRGGGGEVEVKEMKSHTHTRVVVSKMGRVVVISQEALPWVCPSQNRGGRF